MEGGTADPSSPPARLTAPPPPEANVRRLIADIIRQPPPEGPAQVEQPAQQPVNPQPPPAGLAPPIRPEAQNASKPRTLQLHLGCQRGQV